MESVIETIHNSPIKCNIITTGAGASAISTILSVPGASRTLIDAQVPYFPAVSSQLLDNFPKRYLSPSVGAELAQLAYHRCTQVYTDDQLARSISSPPASTGVSPASKGPDAPYFVGVGCTAAVRTDRSRRGEDGAYITCWHERGVENYRILFSKNETRADQERGISALILYALSRAHPSVTEKFPTNDDLAKNTFGLKCVPTPFTGSLENNSSSSTFIPEEGTPYVECLSHALDPFLLLLRRQVDSVIFNCHGIARHSLAPYTAEYCDHDLALYLLFPGSFSPLHWGHSELARVASNVITKRMQEQTGKKRKVILTYEISATIVGKRALRESDLASRVAQFADVRSRVAVTRAKLFVEKAKLFPKHGMVVGIDTAERILDLRFYDGSQQKLMEALNEIRATGCYFIVGGRLRVERNKHNNQQQYSSRANSVESISGSGGGAGTNTSVMKRADSADSTSNSFAPSGAIDEVLTWYDASSLRVPAGFEDMFIALHQEDFRVDISSTEIRARRGDVKEMKLYVDVERIYNELRELGLGPTDKLSVDQLSPFDNYHYNGTKSVDNGVALTKVTNKSHVLDVGSGLGGPARYMAKTYGCKVTAVELQKDVNDVGADLTARCGLNELVTHRSADFMAPSPDFEAQDKNCYDAVVSWLVFVHITDRVTLLKRCFDALKPGGRLFVEDFHKLGAFTKEEEHKLNHDVHCGYVPTLEEFKKHCEAAGFVDVECHDTTVSGRGFCKDRYEGYDKTMSRHIRVHGEETAQGMLHFYKVIHELFDGGNFGLCHVVATKPLI